jgi:hypothetical protein
MTIPISTMFQDGVAPKLQTTVIKAVLLREKIKAERAIRDAEEEKEEGILPGPFLKNPLLDLPSDVDVS